MSESSSVAPGPNERPAAFTDLHTRARRVGQWAWVERRVFELFGDWAGTTADPDAAALFGEMSRRHGWHAEVFFDRLPELASVDAEGLVVPPGPATEAFVGALGAHDPASEPIDRLVAAYRVLLPMLVVEYRSAVPTFSPVAEPSLGRWVDIVLRDDLEEWSRGQQLLSAALTDAEVVRSAGARLVDLDVLAAATDRLTA